MKTLNYIQLGATFFVPATHKNLKDIINIKKYPQLKSIVIDTEDGINNTELTKALQIIQTLLINFTPNNLLIFIRPRNPSTLKALLSFKNISTIDGFVLPKFSLKNANEYLRLVKNKPYYIMPSIEDSDLFDSSKLIELKNLLQESQTNVMLVRFGLEDMLRQLTLTRKCSQSLFDLCATSSVIGQFIGIFKSAGFAISGGVYPCFKDNIGFEKDALRDLQEGLFSKTVIHPNQIQPLHELYKVSKQEYNDALEIIQSKKAVFNQHGKMAETSTQTIYSQYIIKRAEIYGLKEIFM